MLTWSLLGLTLAWLIALGLSVLAVLELVGMRLMVCYFPEGRCWWQVPAQFASLAAFAAVVHFNPF
jgi:hypothetical protein